MTSNGPEQRIGIGKEKQGNQVLTGFNFEGKDGRSYRADYYRFPGAPEDPNRHNFNLPQFKDLPPKLQELSLKIFPQYKPETRERFVNKFNAFSTFALVYNSEGRLVAFNIYKMTEIESKAGPAKTIYVEHAGTDPDFEGKGITTTVRNEFYRQENPDVVCGSSANGAIYRANQHIAETQGLVLYPTGPETPTPIVELANQIHDALGLRNAELDDRLVRTYGPSSTTSRGVMRHPLEDSLPLGPTQHIFYMLLRPEFNQALLEKQGK